MLAGVTVEEVVSVMKNDKGTGKYYDPEFGVMEELYSKAGIQLYLEIFVDSCDGI